MVRFQHLIFDLDGTLVDTRADLTTAANCMLERFGLPAQSVEQVEAHIGHGPRVLVERVLGPVHAHLAAEGFAVFMDSYAGRCCPVWVCCRFFASWLAEIRCQSQNPTPSACGMCSA